MFKTKRWLALAAALSLAVAVLAGCAAPAERLAVKLKAKVAVENCAVETDDAERVRLTATVSLPDYSAYMMDCLAEAERTAKDENDFEETLYALVLDAAADAPAGAPQEIAVDLTVLDDGKAPEDWTAAELDAAARDAAFDAEVEEFCLALLTGTYPADFTPEDGAAESEASAE